MNEQQLRDRVSALLLELTDAQIKRLFVEQLTRLVYAAEDGFENARTAVERENLRTAKLLRQARLARWTAFNAEGRQ